MKPPGSDAIERLKQAWRKNDASLFTQLLNQNPELKARINEPIGAFDSPLITQVRTREMLDVLLEAGADINGRSRWWAGSFGILDTVNPELADYAIERGAKIDIHSASRLGLLNKVEEFVLASPDLVHARGGDGQTPLHFASSIEIAACLIDHGANLETLDLDHESTAAQYMVRDRQEVLRYLIERGCKTDLFIASAIGDLSLAERHMADNPESARMRVDDNWFPMQNPRAGGHIYKWMLGFHVSPHEVAKQFHRENVLEFLMRNSPIDVQLLAGCWMADETSVAQLMKNYPEAATSVIKSYKRQIAEAARNNNSSAVRLMLAANLPVDATGQHGATPLHWAAFHGNEQMVKILLPFNPPLEVLDSDFSATPLGWAIHGSEHGWYCATGNYAATVELLLKAGAKPPAEITGSEAVQAALRSQR